MKSISKAGMVGFAVGVAVSAASAQAAVQATRHEHQTPSMQKPTADPMKGMEGMKDMHAMMSDPVMREKMMANMAQCRDMMSMMLEHMKHEGVKKEQPPPRR